MAGDVDHIVEPAHDPEIAVFIATGTVTGIVIAGECTEIGRFVALRITVDPPQHSRPGLADHQVATFVDPGRFALFGEYRRIDSRQGPGGRTRFESGRIGQRGDHDPAGFGLPPGINDGQPPFADMEVVPHPRLGIDRLSYRTENPQRGEIVKGNGLFAETHQGPNYRGGGVEDVHLELLHHLPEAVRPGIGRHPFKHQGGAPQTQRPVEDVRVSGHPADIGGAPVNILIVQIKYPLGGVHGVGQVTPSGVHHPFGLASRAGGVEDEQQVFRAHRLGQAATADIACHHLFVPPAVAAFLHRHIVSGTADHQAVPYRVALVQSLVGIGF